MPAEKRVLCYCGAFCAVPREVAASTHRQHNRELARLGCQALPAYTPGMDATSEAGWRARAEANRELYLASKSQKRGSDALESTSRASSRVSKRRTEIAQGVDAPENAGPSPSFAPSRAATPGNELQESHEDNVVFDDFEDDSFMDDPPGPAPSPSPSPPPTPEPDADVLPSEDTGMPDVLHIDTLLTAQAFINGLQEATHETSGLPAEAIHRLRHPLQAPPIDLSNDEALRQSIALWVKLARAPENTYDDVHGAVDSNMKVTMKSKKELEKKLQEMTGMYPQRTDMCIDSCVGFAGAYANDVVCPKCRKARWDEVIEKGKKVNKPRKQYLTNPIGPQIQAAWASPESARDMSYRKNITPQILAEYEAKNRSVEKLSDWVHSSEYIEASQNGKIDADTTTLLLSLDGAQLYRNKESDCWIYIWILMDRSPENRYKKPHLVVGGIIPGPHKPKDIDSFLFPGFQHLAALMKEGLMLWDASTGRVFRSKVFLAFATADGPGMQFINGLVGHSGRRGCRLYCDIPGRRKPTSGGHYYPALKKPKPPYNVPNSMHDDIDPWQMPPRPQDDAARQYKTNLAKLASATTAREYEKYRLETGIAKLSLVSGLPSDCIFGIPNCFPPDIMHLAGLNIPDILIALWRATLSCDAPDSKDLWDWAVFRDTAAWKAHGRAVAAASAYLPGSFDRMPRDIAEKLTSGYKATEHLIHLYGFCPALLYGVLPEKYWQHLCKLARALRLVYQRWITKDQLAEAHTLLTEYVDEYEDLYYQREPTRIHLVRQSIHALLHVCPTTYQIGPYAIVSQFPLERMIGDLGQDIRLDSNPYGNLAKIAERRCILNALRHMYPQFADPTPEFPTGAAVLGNGYALLRKRETTPSAVTSTEAAALRTFIATTNIAASSQWLANPFLARWARLRLPNGQTARSRWRDGQSRPSRQVKLSREGFSEFAEVLYYFRLDVEDENGHRAPRGYAMVQPYGPPNTDLLEKSYRTVYSCIQQEEDSLLVVEAKAIDAVVAVVPHSVVTVIPDARVRAETEGKLFIVEKLGLDVMVMAGMVVEDNEGEEEEEDEDIIE